MSVIDSDSGRTGKGIEVGAAPNYIAVDSCHNKIYVANGDSNTVSVIDGNNDTEIRQISLGNAPEYIAVGEKGKIYVTNRDNNYVSVINPIYKSGETYKTEPPEYLSESTLAL